MKNLAGTKTALVLRVLQGVFSASSFASIVSTKVHFTAFSILYVVMGEQVIWGFLLAFKHARALVKKKALHDDSYLGFYVFLDWVTATSSLAAASSCAGITMLYCNELGSCGLGQDFHKFQLAVAFAFMSWITVGTSSLIMLWTWIAG